MTLRNTKLKAALGALALITLSVLIAPASVGARVPNDHGDATPAAKGASSVYIVQMAEDPVVAYTGDVPGFQATAPAKGRKINPNDGKVVRYVDHLKSRHTSAAAAVGASKIYDYTYSFNGFAAVLTPGQVRRLASTPGVVAVTKDEMAKVDTSSTPAFLGLADTGTGLWDQVGGVGNAGEGVIIGVVDTGIWPEHPSFSDRTGTNPNDKDGKLAYQQIPGWHGKCVPGEAFNASHCNQKLIGAQYFYSGFGLAGLLPEEFVSARDFDGHGSHTASTAGGNHGVAATGDAASFGAISGMAPRARIAVYKVCWNGDAGGCFGSDSVAAIDQAVADGVDVINFSISGTSTNYLDPVEVAFLFASGAGIFVSASAGNSGPGAGTANHPSPWLTTVGASTHDRPALGEVTLSTPAAGTFGGASSMTVASVSGSIVNAVNVKLLAASAAEAALCFINTLDPALAAGKIIVCDRGVIARTDKSFEVNRVNGIGMVLVNTADSSLNADLHFVPTVHLSHTVFATVHAHANTPGATATLTKVAGASPSPVMAPFSSRGPSLGGQGDILKPDITAPGVDILAAVAPPGNYGRLFDLYSGTSMSSPHMAGLAALLKGAHPTWSPAAIKSSFMTTATNVVGTYADTAASSPDAKRAFAQGAGHVTPNAANNPGLVYDAGFNDYRNFLKGQGLCNFCFGATPATAIDASNLNQASIAIGDLAGIQSVTRRVTNVSGSTILFNAAVVAPPGVGVVVSPPSLNLGPGASGAFTVTFTYLATVPFNKYQHGTLSWIGGGYTVTSPLVIRPVAFSAPASISASGATGTTSWTVKAGFAGTLTAVMRGLIPATQTAGNVLDDPTNNFNTAAPDSNTGFILHTFVAPAGATYLRFSLFDAFTDGVDDIDLYVYRCTPSPGCVLVGASGSGTSAEEVNIANPTAGATYEVYVHGWQTDGPDANYTLFSWLLDATDAGNTDLDLLPDGVVNVGEVVEVDLDWGTPAPLAPGKYLGTVAYGNPVTIIARTVVRVDVP